MTFLGQIRRETDSLLDSHRLLLLLFVGVVAMVVLDPAFLFLLKAGAVSDPAALDARGAGLTSDMFHMLDNLCHILIHFINVATFAFLFLALRARPWRSLNLSFLASAVATPILGSISTPATGSLINTAADFFIYTSLPLLATYAVLAWRSRSRARVMALMMLLPLGAAALEILLLHMTFIVPDLHYLDRYQSWFAQGTESLSAERRDAMCREGRLICFERGADGRYRPIAELIHPDLHPNLLPLAEEAVYLYGHEIEPFEEGKVFQMRQRGLTHNYDTSVFVAVTRHVEGRPNILVDVHNVLTANTWMRVSIVGHIILVALVWIPFIVFMARMHRVGGK